MVSNDARVERLGPGNIYDFFRLHSEPNGAGLCYCTAWWVPTWEGWGERSPVQNRAFRDQLCQQGEYDGYLYYLDGQPVGWCQAGPRDRLEKLVRQFKLSPDPYTWAVTCFLIAPAYRHNGIAAALLKEVLADLVKRGARRVEAFPRHDEPLGDDDQWTGPEALFIQAGFHLVGSETRRFIYVWEASSHED